MKRIYLTFLIIFLTAYISFTQNRTDTYLDKSWKEVATKMPAKW